MSADISNEAIDNLCSVLATALEAQQAEITRLRDLVRQAHRGDKLTHPKGAVMWLCRCSQSFQSAEAHAEHVRSLVEP